MFKIYDLNMKELPFPEGVKPLDIFVSSVNKRRLTEEFEGRSGTLNYGYDYGERSVDLSLWLEAHDTIDYRLIRNELYAFFDTHDVFYIEETRVPSRVLKVTIDESYIPERINQTHSSVEISCRTLDSVFWESKYTTLELHDSGFAHSAEKYGLVDSIDDEKVKYRFGQDRRTINLSGNVFEQGSLFTSNGQNSDTSTDFLRMRGYYSIDKNSNNKFSYIDTTGTVSYARIFQYAADGTYLNSDERTRGNSNSVSFVAAGDKIRVLFYNVTGKIVEAKHIGTGIIPYIDRPATQSNFTVYNAGNVTVEPESMFLHIFVVSATGDYITIKNNTTGETFTLNRKMTARHIQVNGMIVTDGTTQVFRDTNKRFISLVSGDNNITVTGATFSEIRFDFKYLYK